MVKIYTKTGDKGTTGLLGGVRIEKSSSIIDFIGTVDEISANIGVLKNFLSKEEKEIFDFLRKIQNDFLSLNAVFAGSDLEFNVDAKVKELEEQIDKMHEKLKPLTVFLILGDKNIKEAYAHICRTVTRRAERLLVKHMQSSPHVMYLNRLSDYFFTLARYVSEVA